MKSEMRIEEVISEYKERLKHDMIHTEAIKCNAFIRALEWVLE
jgi:hypothetical protein